MTEYLHVASYEDGYDPPSVTSFYHPVIGPIHNGYELIENATRIRVRSDLTWSKGGCYVSVNAASTITYRSRVNGVNGNQAWNVPAGTTGWFEDAVNSDNIVATDYINWQSTYGVSHINILTTIIACVLDGDECLLGGYHGEILNNTTNYLPLGGGQQEQSANTAAYVKIRYDTTLDYMGVNVGTNSLDNSCYIDCYINGAIVNQDIIVAAGLTGIFEETTKSDAVNSGDNVTTRQWNFATGGSITFGSVWYRSSADNRNLVASNFGSVAFNSLIYVPIEGFLLLNETTENDSECNARIDLTLRNFYVRCYSNSLDAGTDVDVRKNNADTGIVITIPAATTGIYEDVAHTANVLAADEINYMIDTTPSTAGEIRFNILSIESEAGGGPAPPTTMPYNEGELAMSMGM